MQRTFLRKLNSLLLCLFTFTFFSIQAMHTNAPVENFDDIYVNDFLDKTQNSQLMYRLPPDVMAQDIIDILLELNALQILQEDLILRGNSFNKRNILDSPLFRPQRLCYSHNWVLGGHLFYNAMLRTYFSQNCDNVSSYLAISQPSLLAKITEAIPQIQKFFPGFTINPIDILPLFANGTCQERKLGGMFHAQRLFNCVNFQCLVPMYWIERNIFLTEEEKEKIDTALGAASEEEQTKFGKCHGISDRFGIGDTRLDFDFKVKEGEDYTLRAGFFLTVPTACAFAKGLLGTNFAKFRYCRPNFKLEDIFATANLSDPAQAKEVATCIVQQFLIGALDHENSNLLNTGLGGNGHFGTALVFRTENVMDLLIPRQWASNITWRNYLSLEYLLPGYEARFYVRKANPAEFAARNFTDESQSIDNLAFLNEQIINRFYPYAFNTKVYPGFIGWWTSTFHYEWNHWGVIWGSDFWIKGKEKLKCINGPRSVLDHVTLCRTTLPIATQLKVLGSVFYKTERTTRDWLMSLNGDYTYANSGIGKDFTVTFNLEVNF